MAEESKENGLANDESLTGLSNNNVSLDDSFSDLEEYLDFDIYNDEISILSGEDNFDSSQVGNENSSSNVVHFTDPSSSSPNPIPFNLSSLKEVESDEYSDLGKKTFSEDDLDDILLKDSSSQFDDDESIALSSGELDNILADNDDYSSESEDSYESNSFRSNSRFGSDDLDDTYDTEYNEDENITLGSDELDQILNPDEEEEENDFEAKSFFDSEPEDAGEDESIALSSDELDNITNTDYDVSEDFEMDQPPDFTSNSDLESEEEIALSGDELNNLLESGNSEGVDEEDFQEGEARSFFDDDSDENEEIALSPDELSNITNTEYTEDDGIETEDLSAGIESNEYGVSTESIFETSEDADNEDISLSGDELNNILESGEIEHEVEEDLDTENAKSFFDEEEEDDSIALSADELGNITAEEDSEVEDNFDLSEATEDLDMDSSNNLFESDGAEDDEIALSGDELNNLLESGEIESEEAVSMGDSLFEANPDEDESISLSPDELGNITAQENFEEESEGNFDLAGSSDELEMESGSSFFDESNSDEEEIALSGDELNNLLESGEVESEEAEMMGSSLFEEGSDEDDSIALSPDELGNITAEEDYEVEQVDNSNFVPEEEYEFPDSSDDLEMGTSSNLFEESGADDEEIALSGDELNNLLESGEVETEEMPATFDNPIDSGMVIGDDDFVIDDNSSSLSNLGDFDLEDSAPSDIQEESPLVESFNFGSVKKEELKKVVSYMDELLGSLPDSYIKEFASSEYFDLYKKIMKELEL